MKSATSFITCSDGGALRGIAVGFDAVGNRAVFTDIRPPVLIGRRYCCYDFGPAIPDGTSDTYRIRDQSINIPTSAWDDLRNNPGVLL
jgi:hypothetical protein